MSTWFHCILPMETRLPRVTGSQIRDSGRNGYLSKDLKTLLKGEPICSAAVLLLASWHCSKDTDAMLTGVLGNLFISSVWNPSSKNINYDSITSKGVNHFFCILHFIETKHHLNIHPCFVFAAFSKVSFSSFSANRIFN
jgi:hypothetical protein